MEGENDKQEEAVYSNLTNPKSRIESEVYIAYFETKAKDEGLKFITDKEDIKEIHKNNKYSAIDNLVKIGYVERRSSGLGRGKIQLFRSTPKPFVRYVQEVLKSRESVSKRHAERDNDDPKFYELNLEEKHALWSIVNSDWFRKIVTAIAAERMPKEKLNLKGINYGRIETEGAMQFIADILDDIAAMNHVFSSENIVPYNEIAYLMPDKVNVKETTDFDKFAKKLVSKKFKRHDKLVERAFDVCARYIAKRSSLDKKAREEYYAFWKERLRDYGKNLYFLCIPKTLAAKLAIDLGRGEPSIHTGINNGIINYYEEIHSVGDYRK